MKKRNGFEEELGIEEVTVTLDEVNINSEGTEKDIKDDYNKIRESTIKTIIRTSEIIDQAALVIKQNPNALMVKSFADLVKSMKDNTTTLLELHKEIRKLEPKEVEQPIQKEENRTNVREIISFAKEKNKRSL